jgi:hypothetical protein
MPQLISDPISAESTLAAAPGLPCTQPGFLLAIAGPNEQFEVEIKGSWARIGADSRCEIFLPQLNRPVSAVLNLKQQTLEFIDFSCPMQSGQCEVEELLCGGTLWLWPYRLTLVEISSQTEVSSPPPHATVVSQSDINGCDSNAPADRPNFLQLIGKNVRNQEEATSGFLIPPKTTTIGADHCCHLQLRHKTLGGIHAVLLHAREDNSPRLRIVDLFQPSGVYINDVRIDNSILAQKDIVRFGAVRFTACTRTNPPKGLSAEPSRMPHSIENSGAPSVASTKFKTSSRVSDKRKGQVVNGVPALQPIVPSVVPAVPAVSATPVVARSVDISSMQSKIFQLESQLEVLTRELSELRVSLQTRPHAASNCTTANHAPLTTTRDGVGRAKNLHSRVRPKAILSTLVENIKSTTGNFFYSGVPSQPLLTLPSASNSIQADTELPDNLAVIAAPPERETSLVDRLVDMRMGWHGNRMRWIAGVITAACSLLILTCALVWGEVPLGWRELLLRAVFIR